jgi:hypothetical protein
MNFFADNKYLGHFQSILSVHQMYECYTKLISVAKICNVFALVQYLMHPVTNAIDEKV